MSLRSSFLEPLGPDDKLDWGGDWTCNIPPTGQILPELMDNAVYSAIWRHASKGDYDGRQVDWGASAIKVNGPELISVLGHDPDETIDPESPLGRYIDVAQKLGPDKYVAFVAFDDGMDYGD